MIWIIVVLSYYYIFDHLIENRQSRAFSEIDLMGNTSLLNYGQTQFVVFSVYIHSQNLQQKQ